MKCGHIPSEIIAIFSILQKPKTQIAVVFSVKLLAALLQYSAMFENSEKSAILDYFRYACYTSQVGSLKCVCFESQR
jgi:hypothetical protein